MKFNLDIRNRRIILPMLSTYPRSFGRIEDVIDTGAPKTILSAGDAIRLNIPFTSFDSSTPLTGIGKGRTPALLINKFTFSLRNSEEKPANFTMPILVADAQESEKKDKKN